MIKQLKCQETILTGTRGGQPCARTATMIYIGLGILVCGTHARAYTKPGLIRLAYWNEKTEQWA